MTARDDLIALFLANRMPTSSADTTGAAMAEVAADLAISEAGSAEAALAAVKGEMEAAKAARNRH